MTFWQYLKQLRPHRPPRPGPSDIIFGCEFGGYMTTTAGGALAATVHPGFAGLAAGGVMLVLYARFRQRERREL